MFMSSFADKNQVRIENFVYPEPKPHELLDVSKLPEAFWEDRTCDLDNVVMELGDAAYLCAYFSADEWPAEMLSLRKVYVIEVWHAVVKLDSGRQFACMLSAEPQGTVGHAGTEPLVCMRKSEAVAWEAEEIRRRNLW